MQLLLCASTEFEIWPTIKFIQKKSIPNIDVLITGVGMMATAYALTKRILAKKPDFIVQAGLAGSLNESLPLAQIVLVENENIGDLGVDENNSFKTLFDLNLLDGNSFPWQNGKLSNDFESLKSSGLSVVDGVSVNEITTDPDKINYYSQQLNALVESMEGAALHYVALQENIRFLQIRSVSNFVGERDKNKWLTDVAAANLNEELQKILTQLLNQ